MPFDKSRCPCDCKWCAVCQMFGIAYPLARKSPRVETVPARNERKVEERPTVQAGLFDEHGEEA